MKLNGRVAIVTGGASGIGKAIALAFAREGADVVVGDLNGEGAAAAAREVGALSRSAVAVEMDIASQADVRRLMERTLAKFGKVDICCCSAIKQIGARLEDMTEADLDLFIDIGIKGYFFCAQAAGREMLKRGSGNLIFISSIGGMIPYPQAGAYSLVKAATIMMAKLFGVEWADRGIRANCICPGQVRTPLTESMFQDPEIAAGRAAVVPMGRVGTPEEIANVAVFLASDEASFVTAANFVVDGGQVESKMIHTPGRKWGGREAR